MRCDTGIRAGAETRDFNARTEAREAIETLFWGLVDAAQFSLLLLGGATAALFGLALIL